MILTFLGGAGTVTGSKHLVSTPRARVLVDCGLFQGLKSLRDRNWSPLPIDVASLDAVVLTHAHIDHSGYLPVLVRNGFSGRVYVTPPTRDLTEILLADSARLQEEEAWYRNKKHLTRHAPARPLYTSDDAAAVTEHFEEVEFGKSWTVGDLDFRFHVAGHILGAASVEVSSDTSTVVFSGDLGRPADPLIPAPVAPCGADAVVMESTYGDREHAESDPTEELAQIIRRTADRGGVVLLSAFAVGRAQLLLYTIGEIFRRGLVPRIPVHLDSPMATDVTELYLRHAQHHRLTENDVRALCHLADFVRTRDESIALNAQQRPMIIISASGMLSGGRIVHHLQHRMGDERNTIVLSGYQAAGTRGADLASGARSIKLYGERRRVRAEVAQIDVFSAHAGQSELLDWYGAFERPPSQAFLVHGEPHSSDRLRIALNEKFGVEARAVALGESVEVSGGTRRE